MKHVTILVPAKAILGSIEGPRQLLSGVNAYFAHAGQPPLFDVHLAGLNSEVPLVNGLYNLKCEKIASIQKTDLIIIPAVDGDLKEAIEKNKTFLPWITDKYQKGSEVASLCLGAFLLASTGLIDGKKCATHWMSAAEFRKMFPQVELLPDRILTDENGIYSSGGAFSYLNLILYIIEKYAGRAAAIFCAKMFAIDIDRDSQSPFMMFSGHKDHEDEPVKKAQLFIEDNFQNKITVDELASMFSLSRRNLERRFKKATSTTVVEYLQRVKVEAAKKSLESKKKNINEVMYDVGYTDVKAFRTIFRKITGLSPLEYRKRYTTDTSVN